jgi:hypothetical protein
MLPYLQQLDLQLREVVQQLPHLVLPTRVQALQQLAPGLDVKQMQRLVA